MFFIVALSSRKNIRERDLQKAKGAGPAFDRGSIY